MNAVEDALTGDPLIGAYVNQATPWCHDFDGVFSMAVPKGEATIEVSYIGYESQSRQVKCEGEHLVASAWRPSS